MIPALLGVLSPIVGKIIDRIPNATEREKARLEAELQIKAQETELLKLFAGLDQGQIDINKQEAAHSSLFVAGWRPFIGWTCGVGISWAFVLKPILDWFLAAFKTGITTPALNSGELMSLLLALLGMGAIRSFEKVKGVAR